MTPGSLEWAGQLKAMGLSVSHPGSDVDLSSGWVCAELADVEDLTKVGTVKACKFHLPQQPDVVAGVAMFTTAALAVEFGVPELYWRRTVQDPASGLHGQRVGKHWFITVAELRRWLEAGHFSYHPRRKSRRAHFERDLQRSRSRESARRD